MRKLVAGPFCGEFGWELMSWQAFVRLLSQAYVHTVVCCPVGHEALYRDFADEYIPHRITGVKDCHGFKKGSGDNAARQATLSCLKRLGGDLIIPSGFVHPDKQKFVKYGTRSSSNAFDVVVHMRERKERHGEHCYLSSHADKLVARLMQSGLSVAAVGTEAYCPPGAADKRNIPLADTMDLIASCKLFAGPASGPVLLSSLCCTPFVTWTDNGYRSSVKMRDKRRIETLWNPMKTQCTVHVDASWQPDPDLIYKLVCDGISSWKR